jgi:hypothetical protein
MTTGLRRIPGCPQAASAASKTRLNLIRIDKRRVINKILCMGIVLLLLIQVEMKEAEVDAIRKRVQDTKYSAQLIVDEIETEKIIANEKLRKNSLMNDATSVLNDITPDAVEALRKLRLPPKSVGRMMDCILILFQRRLLPVTLDADERFIRPSWREAVAVRNKLL